LTKGLTNALIIVVQIGRLGESLDRAGLVTQVQSEQLPRSRFFLSIYSKVGIAVNEEALALF
jgi:hypothetical protein